MRILLTGSQGQMGQAILHYSKNNSSITLIPTDRTTCDVTDFNSVQQAILQHHPDMLMNCAAYTQVDKAQMPDEKQKVWDINVKGTENLAKICADNNIFLFHLSTDYVFDGIKKTAYVESDETNPISEYGKSKLEGEQSIVKFTDKYIILRVSWVFSEFSQNPLKNILKLMQTRHELSIVNDQKACPTYAGDIADVLLKLSTFEKANLKPGIYHYCNQPGITRFELAKIVYSYGKKISHLNLNDVSIKPITTENFPTPAQRPKNSMLDCSLFLQTFDIPLKPWENSLKHCLENM